MITAKGTSPSSSHPTSWLCFTPWTLSDLFCLSNVSQFPLLLWFSCWHPHFTPLSYKSWSVSLSDSPSSFQIPASTASRLPASNAVLTLVRPRRLFPGQSRRCCLLPGLQEELSWLPASTWALSLLPLSVASPPEVCKAQIQSNHPKPA